MAARNDRTYLEVEIREKDSVKSLGAQWDPGRRKWYVPPRTELTPFAMWLPIEYMGLIEKNAVDFRREAASLKDRCAFCGGSGRVAIRSNDRRPCAECGGTGKTREPSKHPLSTYSQTDFATDSILRSALFDLRRRLARETGQRQYAIYDDTVLERIVRARPDTELALHRVSGMSAAKVARYGDKIIACMLRVLKPGEAPPGRPHFVKCPFCDTLQVLAQPPKSGFRCGKCLRSADPRAMRPALSVKLPNASDFD